MAINLEECGILRQDILDGVIIQLVENLDANLTRQINDLVRITVERRVTDLVDQKVSEKIDEILKQEIQPVNIWGDKSGKKQSIHDMLADSLAAWWTTKVDRSGKPTTSTYEAQGTRVTFYMEKAVKEVLDKEMNDELISVVKEAKTQLRDAMLESVKILVARNLK